MSQHIESVSWKSHAADTLAKRNQMLSSMRNGGGLLPTAASTPILDPAVFQVRGRTAAQNVYNEDVGSAVADIISAGRSQQRPNLAAGGEPESLQAPLSEGSGSRADYWEGSPSPTVLKALPPQRSRPSRVQSSRPQQQEQQSTLPSSLHLPPRVATDINRMHRQEPPPTLSSLLNPSSRATVTPAAPVHLAPLSFGNDPPHSKPAAEDQAFDQHGAEHLGRPHRYIAHMCAFSCKRCVFTLLAGKKYCTTMVQKSIKNLKRLSHARQKTAAQRPNSCIQGTCCHECLLSIRSFLLILLKLRHPWFLCCSMIVT